MIPILYESTETSFTSNGIGALPDCLSCLVTEERNGQYEVEFTYPITGTKYAEILEGRIICVTHDEQLDKQPFIIYRRSAPMDGIVTFNAHHYSYLLSGIAVSPFTASSVADAFAKVSSNSMITNPFTFWTDNTTAGSMSVDIPMSARQILGGVRGSILDVYGGEYEFDKLTVKNHAHRGANNGVTIRYGKNLTDLEQTIDAEFLPNAVVPYWKGSDDTVVYGAVTAATGQTASRVTVMDLSDEFDEQPSAAQLQSAARSKLDAEQPWIPSENITVDFVALWQTEEYKDIALLERVQLCDTVTIYYPELGVNATAKVIKVVWDALLDRYDSMELGEPQSSFADTILSETDARFTEIDEAIRDLPTTSMLEAAIDHATELITGGLGGYVVINTDADGHPTEILIMDTPSTATAVNVWRFNSGGLGHSHSGYNGPYNDIALTQDGQINASMITAGTMSANRIKGGTLSVGGLNNADGVLIIYNAAGQEIGRWDKDGIKAVEGVSLAGTIYLGYETSNKNVYGVIDYRSLRFLDTTGTEFFAVADLRDQTGVATITETFETASGQSSYYVSVRPITAVVEVNILGTTTTDYTWDSTTVTLGTPVSGGTKVAITYKTTNKDAKIYTLGQRKSGGDLGAMSFAQGIDVTASGYASHAEGYETVAEGMYSHAEGEGTTAVYKGAHAEGYGTQAALYGHAEGYETVAGNMAHASGVGTSALMAGQTVVGKYNVLDYQDRAFIVGNGSDDSHRSNAFAVTWDGHVSSAGNITAGGNLSARGTLTVTGNTTLSGNVTATAGTVTVKTQAAGNSSTRAASTAFVGTAVTNGINAIKMFKTVSKSASYSVAANSSIGILANTDEGDLTKPAFNFGTQTGYTAVAAVRIIPGHANVVVRNYTVKATGTQTMLGLRNVSGSTASGTVTMEILYLNSTYT